MRSTVSTALYLCVARAVFSRRQNNHAQLIFFEFQSGPSLPLRADRFEFESAVQDTDFER